MNVLFFNSNCIDTPKCSAYDRSDNCSVIFKKLEKVGEPFAYRNMSLGRYGVIVQRYKLFTEPILTDYSILDAYDTINKTILMALNNKEDMEEKKLNFKPFSLEDAKSGKPVCTRDGRKVRIVCFDAKNGDYPILALVENGEREDTMYVNERGQNRVHPSGYDLMMVSEKKTGWVNIYPHQCEEPIAITGACVYKTQKDAKENASSDCIATIPIEWEE